MRPLSSARVRFLIAAVALLLFVPGLGAVHLFDWDEINFAEIAREMLATGDPLRPRIDFQPFHEKPPLFIWLQAISMAVFGVNEFAARFPNAICGVITLQVLYNIGTRIRGGTFGLLWVMAYVGSILPHLYFRSGIIDPWFNLLIFLGLHALIRCAAEGSDHQALLCGLFLGLAVLTKGPVGVLIPFLVVAVHWTFKRFEPMLPWRMMGMAFGALLVTILCWAAIDVARNGTEFMVAFFWRQVALLTTEDAGHGGFMGYHVVVLLFGCFPASFFALQELLKPTRDGDDRAKDFRRWMVILFWVVLILFSLVKTKIVHYSSLCYFPLTFLAALRIERIWTERERFGWTRFAVGILGSVIGAVVIALPFLAAQPEKLKPLFAADPFAQDNLDALVHWSGWEALAGLWLLAAMVTAHFMHARGRIRESLIAVFGGSALFVTFTLYFFINNIEAYSQRAAVEFFEARKAERCYVTTLGYKSYAPWFYARTTEASPDDVVLRTGSIDRPVYLSCKITSVEEVKALGTFHEIGRKNGFVFWRREP